MTIYHQDGSVTVHHGDCLDVLPTLPDNSIDAIVTDPQYGLSSVSSEKIAEVVRLWATGNRNAIPDTKGGFMSKSWDAFVPPPAVWDECLRVLKPGGHLLCFAGTQMFDLATLSIRLAGFEIRDSIGYGHQGADELPGLLAWVYGSGFPKSMDVSKAIDKAAGAEREVVGVRTDGTSAGASGTYNLRGRDIDNGSANMTREVDITAPATDAAKQWAGWGTALKPAWEPIIVARKPLVGTVAANVLKHGTGALNIDACRIEAHDSQLEEKYTSVQNAGPRNNNIYGTDARDRAGAAPHAAGRWPPNVVLDESQAAELDQQSGPRQRGAFPGQTRKRAKFDGRIYAGGNEYVGELTEPRRQMDDSGGASRFFPVFKYTAKAAGDERPTADGGSHPTVKPLDLVRWLCKLVVPPHGLVLDPFAGSGTTGEAVILEHMRAILIEKEADYMPLIVARLHKPMQVGFDFED